MRRAAVAFLAFAFWVGCACGPKIDRFDVVPLRICAGAPVTVSWKTNTSENKLETNPSAAVPSQLPASGSATATLSDSTRFQLTAGSGSDAKQALQDVTVFKADGTPALAFQATLDGTLVHAALHVDEARWDEHVRIDTLRADWSGAHDPPRARPITVIHAGKTITLPADGTASIDLRGVVVAGDWELTAATFPEEVAVPPTAHAPKQLHLIATITCAP